jgi:hypothetical protein
VQAGVSEGELAVRDVSRGGALLEAPAPLAEVGQALRLGLRLPEERSALTLTAEVVRHAPLAGPHPEGHVGLGVRFVEVSAEQRLQLLGLLDRVMSSGRGTSGRAHPRVSHRLEVRCHSRRELRALLRDVSHGGMGLWVDTALERGERVTVGLPQPDGTHFEVAGLVVECRPLEDERGGFRAGLRLEPLSLNARLALPRFLRGLYHPEP